MEYFDKLKNMYTDGRYTIDIKRCVNYKRLHNSDVMRIYKEIFMEVLSIKYNNHPVINKNPFQMDKYIQDSYDAVVRRQRAVGQYDHTSNTDLALIPGEFEKEQMIVKKIWYYNDVTMIRLERFVEYNQYDVARFIQLSRDMIYNDPVYIRFKKAHAHGVLRAFIPKTKWFWNVIEKSYHPEGRLGKMAIDEFDNNGIYV
ncbi:hypothetical protein EXVG_00378 [Emiliania huxleyi virus 202]|nr:hypothetical protein EXVG_00378 [Emiliania huxleyi virus 202]AHA55301.1 hypothetical protein EhV156_00205 [Emiliania huxleyi virus 156]